MQTYNLIVTATGLRQHSAKPFWNRRVGFCGYMKGSKRSRRKTKLLWHWTRNPIFKHCNEPIRPNPCVPDKLNGKSLSMCDMEWSTSLPYSICITAKCAVGGGVPWY